MKRSDQIILGKLPPGSFLFGTGSVLGIMDNVNIYWEEKKSC